VSNLAPQNKTEWAPILAAKGSALLDAPVSGGIEAAKGGSLSVMVGGDAEQLKGDAVALCAKAFGTAPTPGVITYLSRGTDDDAHGVLAGFGITGEITRTPGDDGFDIIDVTLQKVDLDRIPESRIHTALEASLNCEVHIRTV